jgi:hypothetical protein
MPVCKNDKVKKYTGNEPSPKGSGYCAHAEKVNTKKKGKDGNTWIVKKISNGSKRWCKHKEKSIELSCSNVVYYAVSKSKKKIIMTYSLRGIKSDKPGYIHKFIDFNEVEEKATKIPKGYRKTTAPKWHVKEFYCDPSRKRLEKNNEEFKRIKTTGYKTYVVHDNGGRPFVVYVGINDIKIYKQNKKKYYIKKSDWKYKSTDNKWAYVKLVAKYKNLKTFVGKDPNYGKYSIGNSILTKIGKNRYVFIGESVYEFSTSDEIVDYMSLLGNSNVPWPVAYGKINVYFFMARNYVPIKDVAKNGKNITKKEKAELYEEFGKPFIKIKNIHKRLW